MITAAVVHENKFADRLLQGKHEISFFWTDEATGEECKCRPDDIVVIGDQHILVDYKTTDNAETEAFRSSAIKYGYDLQAGMYLEGTKQTPVRMRFSCLSHRKRKSRMQSIFCKRMNSW